MKAIRPFLAALPLVLCALLTSCGKNLSIPDVPASPSTIGSGNWYVSGFDKMGGDILILDLGGSLLNTGGQINGVFHINSSCFGEYTTNVPYTGTLDSNNKLSITSSRVSGQILTLHGTLSSDDSILNDISFSITGGCSGNLTNLTGSDGPGASFDPTGERIPSLTGSWTTATNSSGPAITEQLTQSSTPDTNGDFALSGTVAVQGSPCFTQGVIQPTSFVSGYLGQQTILMNDGSILSASMQLTFQVFDSVPIKPLLLLGPATITGGNCNGPIEINLQ